MEAEHHDEQQAQAQEQRGIEIAQQLAHDQIPVDLRSVPDV